MGLAQDAANVKILPVQTGVRDLGVAYDINSNGEIVGSLGTSFSSISDITPVYWESSSDTNFTYLKDTNGDIEKKQGRQVQ